jgi:hypothetical protein
VTSFQSKSIALTIIEASTNPADVYWASEGLYASVEYHEAQLAKVFTFDDRSRIRVTPDSAELLP